VCRGDAWWIVAYCRVREDARAFRVDAISEWQAAGPFQPREGFSFDAIIQRDRGMAEDLFGY
jgi:predicted DNA-binding transcriptional regulator YafY